MNSISTSLKQLPKDTVEDILQGINSLGEPEITVSVARKNIKLADEFVFYFLTNMNSLMADPEITKQDLMVLMQYATKMKYGNQLSISQLDIAEDLKIDKSKVSKSVKKLIERGVFYREKRSLFMNCLRVASDCLRPSASLHMWHCLEPRAPSRSHPMCRDLELQEVLR